MVDGLKGHTVTHTNALGRVAVIFGVVTWKLLHNGVRNKYCYRCSSAESRHCEPTPHLCFRNWNDTTQVLEANIIVEGFREAEKTHGVCYMRWIADGDRSVYARTVYVPIMRVSGYVPTLKSGGEYAILQR